MWMIEGITCCNENLNTERNIDSIVKSKKNIRMIKKKSADRTSFLFQVSLGSLQSCKKTK